jgi:serine acetyltransferase
MWAFLWLRELYNFKWLIKRRFPLSLALCHIWFEDIPKSTFFPHPYGITIRVGTKMGEHCVIMSNVTIGQRRLEPEFAEIGDRVIIGTGAIILGPVKIGNGAWVGAGSIVLDDVPSKSVVAGNPAKVIRRGVYEDPKFHRVIVI